jgi:hypothetical protein
MYELFVYGKQLVFNNTDGYQDARDQTHQKDWCASPMHAVFAASRY